ncbi:SUEL-type lectin domain-containing protein [Plasmodiophora brassicae]
MAALGFPCYRLSEAVLALVVAAVICFNARGVVGDEPLRGYVYAGNTTFPRAGRALQPVPALSSFAQSTLDFTYTWWAIVNRDSVTYSNAAFMLVVSDPVDSQVLVRAPAIQLQKDLRVKAYCQTSKTSALQWPTLTSVQSLTIGTWVFLAASVSSGPKRNLTLSFTLPSGNLSQKSVALPSNIYTEPTSQQVWGTSPTGITFLGAFRDLRFWPQVLSSSALNQLRASTIPTKGSSPPGVIGDLAFDGYAVSLQCPNGTAITSILFASYGTPEGWFPDFTIGDHHSPNSTAIVQGACFGLSSCQVVADSSLFGDPFPDNVKRLSVSALCTNASDLGPASGYSYMAGVGYPIKGQVLSPSPSLSSIAQATVDFTYTMWLFIDPNSRLMSPSSKAYIMVVQPAVDGPEWVRAPGLQFQAPQSLYVYAATKGRTLLLDDLSSSCAISVLGVRRRIRGFGMAAILDLQPLQRHPLPAIHADAERGCN